MKRVLIIIGCVFGCIVLLPLVLGVLRGGLGIGLKPGSNAEAQALLTAPPAKLPDWRPCLSLLPNEPGDAASDYAGAIALYNSLDNANEKGILSDPRIDTLRQQLNGLTPFNAEPNYTPADADYALVCMVAAQSAFQGAKKISCSHTWVQEITFDFYEWSAIQWPNMGIVRGLGYLGDYCVETNPQLAQHYYEAAVLWAGRHFDDSQKEDKPSIGKYLMAGGLHVASKHLEAFHRHTGNSAAAALASALTRESYSYGNWLRKYWELTTKRKAHVVEEHVYYDDPETNKPVLNLKLLHPDSVANAILLATESDQLWVRWEASILLRDVRTAYPAARKTLEQMAMHEPDEALRTRVQGLLK